MGYFAESFFFVWEGGAEIKRTRAFRCHPQISGGRVIIPGPPMLSTPSSNSCSEICSCLCLLCWTGSVGRGSQGFP